ncbi:hypothetical protein Ahy_B08g091128 [Arachis hypogaea]|uniref:MULE transposase domain-containing protein n=1 Tax=Arachis hypogaea TaxID=3818 RepID=A0A444Y1H7_ARAHY|nr:hypothetical protein Ahy_B08g091128 [Arachis hypogaea]
MAGEEPSSTPEFYSSLYDEKGSIIFKSGQQIITYIVPEINSLTALKNLILHSVGKQYTKRLGGRGSYADTVDDSPSSGAVRRNIRRMMVDLNMPPEGSQEGSNIDLPNAGMMQDNDESHKGSVIRDPMMDPYEVNPDDGDDANDKPTEIPDDGDDGEEMNFYVKRYNIRRTVEYKILESDQLKYDAQFYLEHTHNISPKARKWEVRRYNGPHTCQQTSMGQDHRRLDSKVIAQYIFTMVKADPTISIKVLQGGMENHFSYKASYIKVWIVKQKSLLEYMAIRRSHTMIFLVGYSLCICTYPVRIMTLSLVMYLGATCDTVLAWFSRHCHVSPAFKHCKPLISIDDTHLYGKYGGTLLMAIAQDGNSNILPIVFAVVEGETKEAWLFFLSYLREHVTLQPSILVISNRHKPENAGTILLARTYYCDDASRRCLVPWSEYDVGYQTDAQLAQDLMVFEMNKKEVMVLDKCKKRMVLGMDREIVALDMGRKMMVHDTDREVVVLDMNMEVVALDSWNMEH